MVDLEQVLADARVLVTAHRRSDELAEALERRGARVDVVPLVGPIRDADLDETRHATQQFLDHGADIVVITTAVGLRAWVAAVDSWGWRQRFIERLSEARVLARGPKGVGALRSLGIAPSWVAASETSAEIVDYLRTQGVRGSRVVIQHHGGGDPGMEEDLGAAGAIVQPVQVYRSGPVPDRAAVGEACAAVAAGAYDAVLFTSAPAAEVFCEELRRRDLVASAIDSAVLVAAVGPVTGQPLEAAGFRVEVPERFRMGALVRLVIDRLATAGPAT